MRVLFTSRGSGLQRFIFFFENSEGPKLLEGARERDGVGTHFCVLMPEQFGPRDQTARTCTHFDH